MSSTGPGTGVCLKEYPTRHLPVRGGFGKGSIEFGEGYGMYVQTRLGFGSGLDFNHSPPMGRYTKSPLDIKTVTNSNFSFFRMRRYLNAIFSE